MTQDIRISVVVIILFMLTIVIIAQKKKDSFQRNNEYMPITSVQVRDKAVAVACNVYEGTREVVRILDILNNNSIKITFFVSGQWAEKNKSILVKMKESGQDIQNHGYSHKRPTIMNKQKNLKEIIDTERIVYEITGDYTFLFEPPYGDFDEETINTVKLLRYRLVTCSIDTLDWRYDASETAIIQRIKRRLQPGAIILIHPRNVTVKCFEEMIRIILSEGYRIESVSGLISKE